MNNYFKNKIIIIYPFIPLIVKNGNEFSGFKFKSLEIRHYIPIYSNIAKPKSKDLRSFFDGLIRQIITQRGEKLSGLGYSVHLYDGTEEDKEKKLNELRDEIELLYFLFHQSNNQYETAFPKFYVLDRINKFEKEEFNYSFELWENLERSTHYFLLSKKIDSRRETIPIRIKTSNYIQEPFIDVFWKRRLTKRLIDRQRILRGIFWANNVKDRERRAIEKIVASTIAVETMLNIPKNYKEKLKVSTWSEAFAMLAIKKMRSAFPEISKGYLDKAKQAFIQAVKTRSDVVHGRNVYELVATDENSKKYSDIKIKFGDERYFFVYDILYEIFEILLYKKISGDKVVSGIRFENLLKKIYPNKDTIDSTISMVQQRKNIFTILANLRDLKEYDITGITSKKLALIITYINNNSSELTRLSIPFKNLGKLSDAIRKEKGWLELHELGQEVEAWNIKSIWTKERLEKLRSVNGFKVFLQFLSHFVMVKSVERNRRAIDKSHK